MLRLLRFLAPPHHSTPPPSARPLPVTRRRWPLHPLGPAPRGPHQGSSGWMKCSRRFDCTSRADSRAEHDPDRDSFLSRVFEELRNPSPSSPISALPQLSKSIQNPNKISSFLLHPRRRAVQFRRELMADERDTTSLRSQRRHPAPRGRVASRTLAGILRFACSCPVPRHGRTARERRA